MAKKSKANIAYEHQRGEIKQSAIKALVTDPLFKVRIERNRKGKGSYQRNAKHRTKCRDHYKGESPFKNVYRMFLNGLFAGGK